MTPATRSSTLPPATPNAATELDLHELREDLSRLSKTRLFWVGLSLKLTCAVLFGSHFATRWFSPFVYEFVHSHFANPWETFLARGEPLAFPYGPVMLGLLSLSYLPAWFVSFDPASHIGLVLLRLPLLAADLAICVLLMRWLRMHARDVVIAYWLSPIVLYATYVHGQLDLIPTAMLCVALYLMFTRRLYVSAAVFGLALGTKGHLVIALPFALAYLYRKHRNLGWLKFAAVTVAVTLAVYSVPLSSPGFRALVLGSSEARKLWAVAIPYGLPGIYLYIAPSLVMIAFFRFFSYRRVNRELTMMFIGALYVGLVAVVPPQPGWFIWSIPFVSYLAARFARTGRYVLIVMSVAYLVYFLVADPAVFLESMDPILGPGFGATAANRLRSLQPGIFSGHGASIAWSFLFSATALTGLEMYRKGVRSNAIYNFRDETFMIGIGGDSGAGKHTIGNDLVRLMGSPLSLLNGDDDHRWERGHAMWRRYTHLDPRGNQLAAQLDGLAALKRGHQVRKRHYDHDAGTFTDPILLKPTEYVGIVGLHPFYLASQRLLLHLKVFVDTDEDLRREWKVARDVKKRGYTEEQVIEQMDRRKSDSVKYVHPQRRHADVVIRHMGAAASENSVHLEVELAGILDPLRLLDVLSSIESIEVDWVPDETLMRDTLKIKGEVTIDELKAAASLAIPNVEDLIDERSDGWRCGGRGLTQLVIVHALSARLRAEPGSTGVVS